MQPTYTYRAVVRSIYDGDTMRIDIDLGCSIWLRNEPIRLFGIDTPELRGDERPAGLIARDRLREKLPDGSEIVIETFKDRKGKYGRYLGRIWLGDLCINDWLISEGLAVEYLSDRA